MHLSSEFPRANVDHRLSALVCSRSSVNMHSIRGSGIACPDGVHADAKVGSPSACGAIDRLDLSNAASKVMLSRMYDRELDRLMHHLVQDGEDFQSVCLDLCCTLVEC